MPRKSTSSMNPGRSPTRPTGMQALKGAGKRNANSNGRHKRFNLVWLLHSDYPFSWKDNFLEAITPWGVRVATFLRSTGHFRKIIEEGKLRATRQVLRQWAQKRSEAWHGAMEATLFSSWIYDA